MPDGEQLLARGSDYVVTSSGEWATCQTACTLKQGQRPDLVSLNLVVEGTGKLWLRDVTLLRAPLK
jgi:hypothetical protein